MISVIIPTHNRSGLLKRAMNSVINQTYKDIQLIVVSDGSTDDTEEVVKGYQKEYGFIEYISVFPNKGANNARNEGIEASKGDYIAFLDDDDEWLPSKLEKQLAIFDKNNHVGIVYTGINVIYNRENVSYLASAGHKGNLSKEILISNVIGSTSSVIVRKSVLEKAGYFDIELPAAQDYDLWIRVCQVTEVGYVPEACVNYYNEIGEDQISSHIDKYEYAAKLREDKYQSLYNNLSKEEVKDKELNNYLGLATTALRNNKAKTAFKYCFKAFKSRPNIKSIIYCLMIPVPFKWVLKFRTFVN